MSKSELYATIARRFLASGVEAYLWRDPEAFPKLVGFDMDIIVAGRRSLDRAEVLVRNVLEHCGWKVFAYIRRGAVHTLLTGRAKNASLDDDGFLQIDLHRQLTASGVPYVDLATLVERAINVDGARFLCRTDGAIVSFLGPILTGIRPKPRYELAFDEAQHADSERVSNILQQALGNRAAALLKPSAACHGLWRQALLTALRLRPAAVCKVLCCTAAERLSAFLHPPSRMISLSGPDGVGKTTAINILSSSIGRRICMGVHIYHTRPYLIPRLAHFLPRRRRDTILTTRTYEPRISYFKSWLRLAILILDYNLGYWLKIRQHLASGKTVIFDRYFLDIRADPRIRGICLPDWILERAELFVPKPDLRVLLVASPRTIASRKQDLSLIEAKEQLARYRELISGSTNCLVLDTDETSPRELCSRIIGYFSRSPG